MATPSPSPSPPPPPSPSDPIIPSPKPITTVKKPQPIPWTHQETINLIRAYQEKWYSLKRGQLKAGQWEEVAVTVAARCGYDHSHPSAKSAIQCRHKIEKLRKRFRSEKQRILSLPVAAAVASASSSPWPYFDLMDSLQCGPLPISALPLALIPSNTNENRQYLDDDDIADDDDNEEEEDEDDKNFSKSRSINYILRRPTFVNRFAGSGGGGVKRRRAEDEAAVVDEGERGKGAGLGLAAEIRAFAERFVGMEKMKMEMMRETEKCRMEMENKRIEMIMDSQQKIVDTIGRAFGSQIKLKMGQREV